MYVWQMGVTWNMSEDYGGRCVTIMKSERTGWVGIWHAWGGDKNVYTKCIYNFYWEILGQEISREI